MRNPISGWSILTSSIFKTSDTTQDLPFLNPPRVKRGEDGKVVIMINLAGEAGEDVGVALNSTTHTLSIRLDSAERQYSTELDVDPYLKPQDVLVFWNEGMLEIILSEPSGSAEQDTVEIPVYLKEPEDFVSPATEDVAPEYTGPVAVEDETEAATEAEVTVEEVLEEAQADEDEEELTESEDDVKDSKDTDEEE